MRTEGYCGYSGWKVRRQNEVIRMWQRGISI
nr:MAG TPA: hypothetical protein [Caudoviricetes sp.]